MTEITAWLATLGRTRVIPGDHPPEHVRRRLTELVREHRTALGLPVGYALTAADINAALDWHEQLREQQRAEILDAYEIPESLRAAWRQIDEEA